MIRHTDTDAILANGNVFRKIGNAVLDLLFPPKCPFCGAIVEHPGICAGCRADLPWTDAADAIRETPDGFQCAGALRYEGKVRDGLLRFKFQGGLDAAAPLGDIMAGCAAAYFSGAFDTVTWMPVSAERREERGYDQSEWLAKYACRAWEIKPVKLLVKIRDNPAQSTLPHAGSDTCIRARRDNVRNVYAPAKGAQIAGRRILLVDDICTTGATLREARRVLLDAGAESVCCVTVALAGEWKS